MLARWCKRLLEFSFTELPEWSWITVRCAVADWTGPADAYVTGSWSALDCEVAEPVLELVSLCNTSTAITRLDCKHQALLSAPLSAVLKFISAAAEWYLSGQKSGCLRELCSALLDLRGQASSLFLARLWVLEEMGLWRGGARSASGEGSSSEPDQTEPEFIWEVERAAEGGAFAIPTKWQRTKVFSRSRHLGKHTGSSSTACVTFLHPVSALQPTFSSDLQASSYLKGLCPSHFHLHPPPFVLIAEVQLVCPLMSLWITAMCLPVFAHLLPPCIISLKTQDKNMFGPGPSRQWLSLWFTI